MSDSAPYNPLDKKNLGASVAEAMLERKVHPLGKLTRTQGAGIYAIYYTGDFPAYAPLTECNKDDKFAVPIYVGKAIPTGARKGGGQGLTESVGHYLHKRLSEHAQSIRSVQNLKIEDFHCRYLVVDDIWIPLGESLLIAKFAPVWNSIVDGFGNHTPGSGRFLGLRPRWDTLHPGRAWAEKCQARSETSQQIIADIEHHLKSLPLLFKRLLHAGGKS